MQSRGDYLQGELAEMSDNEPSLYVWIVNRIQIWY